MMIQVIITSYNEPQFTLRAVMAFLNQKSKQKMKVTVVDPFPEVGDFLKKNIKSKKFEFFLDPGEGKSYALNLLFQEYWSDNKDDLFILSDGDVYVSDNAVEEIVEKFKNPRVGCVAGRPVSLDSKDNKYGLWSKIVFAGIHKTRKKLSSRGKFFECSGYLFAIRKGIISDFPLETSEDSIIPYLFWKKGYKMGYVPEAEVFVKNPGTWSDWLAQKVRNVKGHENLNKLAPDMPRTKSFWNEIRWGALFALRQPRSMKQVWWTLELYAGRLYLYFRAFKELRSKKKYEDGWRGQAMTESTKME